MDILLELPKWLPDLYPAKLRAIARTIGSCQLNQERSHEVVIEIQRRAKNHRPLNSGANRGDWLYAAAVLAYGSWGSAIQAAGLDYEAIRQNRPLDANDVLDEIRQIAKRGEPFLVRHHSRLGRWAKHHFGSWRAAVLSAGHKPERKWTPERFAAIIKAEVKRGRPVTSLAVIDRLGEGVYKAGCRLHGSWRQALQTVGAAESPHGTSGRSMKDQSQNG